MAKKRSGTRKGVKGTGGDFRRLAQEISVHERVVIEEAEHVLDRGLEDAAEWMRMVIMSSGTGWVGVGPRAVPDGRIDYGYMHDSVSTTGITRVGNTLVGKFGWLRATEDYFKFQDEGFRHWKSGRQIEGMHALAQASAFAKETIEYELRKL